MTPLPPTFTPTPITSVPMTVTPILTLRLSRGIRSSFTAPSTSARLVSAYDARDTTSISLGAIQGITEREGEPGILWLGIYPKPVLDRMEPTVLRLVEQVDSRRLVADEVDPAAVAAVAEAEGR